MKRKIELLLIRIFRFFGAGITNYSTLEQLRAFDKDISEVLSKTPEALTQLCILIKNSKSQLKQDLFVLSELNLKHGGFFVEFGSTNGFDLSNTYLLEKEFGWRGILAEPAKFWHSELVKNRDCHIDNRCVWRSTGEKLVFTETVTPGFSGIGRYNNEGNSDSKVNKKYEVETVSLIDLLAFYNSPSIIDYLSIDTEGSEFEILNKFDFSKYHINVITCEHNYTATRKKVEKLLTTNGFVRKYISFSKWDDWYINKNIL